jgi:menaquinone-9 beta-reductase
MTADRVEVAVVGGGPAGAVTAALLADLGHDVVLLERAPRWRWRACGVFAAPACISAFRRVGIDVAELAGAAIPVPAMRVESRAGATFRLTYGGSGSLADSAVGFDREVLDGLLLDKAEVAGARVQRGARVTKLELGAGRQRLLVAPADAPADGMEGTLEARFVVGADGLRSIVAGAAGVRGGAPFADRAAVSFHVPWEGASDARMVVVEDGYIGLAPVPGERLNVGIVLGGRWRERLRRQGAATVARDVLGGVWGTATGADDRTAPTVLDRVEGVRPASTAVTRRAGEGWVLVGDAAGFLDPFTGEGIHRAIVSAELAATSIHEVLSGRRIGASLGDYDHAMRARFGAKDLVSRLVQGFLARPALFEYAARRLETRAGVRDTLGGVIGDLEPASRALDPRFLAALLAP